MEEMNWFMCCRAIGDDTVEKKKKKSIEEDKGDKTVASFFNDIAWKSEGSVAYTFLLLSFQPQSYIYQKEFQVFLPETF